MNEKRKLKKIAAKSVKLLHNKMAVNKENTEIVMKNLKTLPRAQAIYAIGKFIKGLRRTNQEGKTTIESSDVTSISGTSLPK